MGRRGGIIMALAREAARQQRVAHSNHIRALREAERQMRLDQREAERQMRSSQKMAKEYEREQRAQYLRDREQEVADLNGDLEAAIHEIQNILEATLAIDDALCFESLKVSDHPPALDIPLHLMNSAAIPKEETFLSLVKPLGFFGSLLPWVRSRHARDTEKAKEAFSAAVETWKTEDAKRMRLVTALKDDHSRKLMDFNLKKTQRNAEVDEFAAEYHDGNPDAIVSYMTLVLERSEYPETFPRHFSAGYNKESKQAIVEFELPNPQIIPNVLEYKYVKSSDTISERPRKESDIKNLYQDLIASIALRTIHEIFESDRMSHIDVVCFNGYVNTIDPATGRDIRPHLISVRTTREIFTQIDLARVDKRVCLRNLGAQVSRSASEAQPVKPIVEFNMVDSRFVDQADLMSSLSAATNLMDLNPFEFEQLVANLFNQMGLESKLTRSSRDGGVDCVAFDPRPVLGGKVVIQAKRYKNTVGVSAVRDLYGTMLNEGASKGILVATSGYGTDAFTFAKDKPIELIDGGGLLFLLREIGFEARIVFPET